MQDWVVRIAENESFSLIHTYSDLRLVQLRKFPIFGLVVEANMHEKSNTYGNNVSSEA
jgi:hypothetical protein